MKNKYTLLILSKYSKEKFLLGELCEVNKKNFTKLITLEKVAKEDFNINVIFSLENNTKITSEWIFIDNKKVKADFLYFSGTWIKKSFIKNFEKLWWISVVSSKNLKFKSKWEQFKRITKKWKWDYYPKSLLVNNISSKKILNNWEINLPFIIKTLTWWNWTWVELIQNKDDLDLFIQKKSKIIKRDKWLLIQEKLDCKPWEDYRIYIVWNKVIKIIKRTNENSFKANAALWWQKEEIDLVLWKKLFKKAIKASKFVFKNLLYYWLDLIIKKNWEVKIIEINIVWNFSDAHNVAKALIEEFIKHKT